jgi:RNA polymerase sigma-70 factor (ECF subfamily)
MAAKASTHVDRSGEHFETHRALLFAIAYRMTGSVMEAEDLVQESYLRYCAVDPATIVSHRALLTTIIARLAINWLNSARVRRESYVGPWLPEPVPTANNAQLVHPPRYQDNAQTRSDTLHDSISSAFLRLLERLTPLERVVFVLHEVFDVPYREIAAITERSEAAVRKLGTRAKQHISERQARFVIAKEQYHAVIDTFLDACQNGDLQGLMDLLAQEATIYTDGGGKARAGTRPVSGQEVVARFILGGLRSIASEEYSWQILELNDRPAIIVMIDGRAFGVIHLDLNAQHEITEIHFITNPDKLNHL